MELGDPFHMEFGFHKRVGNKFSPVREKVKFCKRERCSVSYFYTDVDDFGQVNYLGKKGIHNKLMNARLNVLLAGFDYGPRHPAVLILVKTTDLEKGVEECKEVRAPISRDEQGRKSRRLTHTPHPCGLDALPCG